MEIFWWVGVIVGVIMPIVVYAVNFIRFGQKKQALEQKLGERLPVSWKSHSQNLLFSFYPLIVLLNVSMLAAMKWFHEDFGIAVIMSLLFLMLFLWMPYNSIYGLTCGFFLGEFLTPKQLSLWYENEAKGRTYMFTDDKDRYLSRVVLNADYIPCILNAIPLIEKKGTLLAILEDLEKRPLSAYELEVQASSQTMLKEVENELDKLWKDLQVAVGHAERPEELDKRKEESVREFERMSNRGAGTVQKQADPALKELYTLTANEEAPEDLKQLAHNAILQIEAKLEKEERNEKEEAVRRSGELVIETARKYHGVEAN